MVPATGTATFVHDSVPMATKAATASTQPPISTAQARGSRRSAKDRAFMIRAENRRLRCSLSTAPARTLKDCAHVCHILAYDEDHTTKRLMKTPLRLIFGLVLGLALGYGLTLLARPAASRRTRRRRRSVPAPDAREREAVH